MLGELGEGGNGKVGVGLTVHFYKIGEKGLWLDEAFSVWLGWQTLSEMLAWVSHIDQHPPLYYTLLHFWMLGGDSATMVRALSACLGILNIPLLYWLGKRLAGPGLGLLAALIITLAPFQVRFAQETRMYTMLNLNATLALLALIYLLTDRRSKSGGIGRQLWQAYHTRQISRSALQTDLAWLGYIIFNIWFAGFPVKNKIGGNMDQ